MSSSSPPGPPRRPHLDGAVQLLAAVYMLAMVACLVWALIPAHRRRLLAMQLLQGIRSGASWAACRSGRAAMGQELRCRTENYALPYVLSRVRDAAGRAYDRARYSS